MSLNKQALSSEPTVEQDPSEHRLVGAVVWLALLVIVVPIWYSNPVNFIPPDFETAPHTSQKTLGVEKPFVLPGKERQPSVKQAEAERQIPVNLKPKTDVKAQTVEPQVRQSLQKISSPLAQPKTTEKKATEPKTKNIVWIIRLIAYRKQENAEMLHSRLKYDYQAYVKYFPEPKYYSVRVGPYESEAQAKKDQIELNRLLRVKSELVKIDRSLLNK